MGWSPVPEWQSINHFMLCEHHWEDACRGLCLTGILIFCHACLVLGKPALISHCVRLPLSRFWNFISIKWILNFLSWHEQQQGPGQPAMARKRGESLEKKTMAINNPSRCASLWEPPYALNILALADIPRKRMIWALAVTGMLKDICIYKKPHKIHVVYAKQVATAVSSCRGCQQWKPLQLSSSYFTVILPSRG